MFKPNKKQIPSLIGGAVLLSMFAILAYAAVFFAPSQQPIGYIGQPAMSNYNVTSGTSVVYRGIYNSYDWSGQFTCYPVSSTGYVDLAAPCFTSGASSPLDVQAAAATRNIGTLSDSTTAPAAEAFSTSGLTAGQQTALGGTANINWIIGTSLSPSGLRARTTVLGDIIHSRPYYWADTANSGANPTVFVGANDGMLHAFDAITGKERWAYVPSMLITAAKMGQLPSTGYQHDYFVDGGLAINTLGTTPVLVGALGAGGKGLYALSLASLTAASATSVGAKAMWEITPNSIATQGTRTNFTCPAPGGVTPVGSYCNLGYTYSSPLLLPTQDGNTSVIVGNGYNNTGNGHATLYVINATTGALIREIDTGVGSTSSPNGLSSVTVIDTNGDGKGDRAYAGDINGNMWVFDLSSANPASWSVRALYSIPSGTLEPVAITMAPVISPHPYGGYMVNFATGRVLSQSNAATIPLSTTSAIDDTADQTTSYAAYGLWDIPAVNTIISTGSLLTQSIATATYTPPAGSPLTTSETVLRLTTDNQPNWKTNGSGTRGWTVPLKLQGGERVTGDMAFVDAGKFQFNVTNPTVSSAATGSSAASNGVNYLVELDYLYGGAGAAPFMDLNQDNVIDSKDLLTSGGTAGLPATLIPVGYLSSNGVQSQPILLQLAQNRIPLYNQNYNASSTPTNLTGVSGGHFDVDVFYTSSGYYRMIRHVHEYDKNYDVNGLNPLNPNNSSFPLSKVPGITATTPYKVLVMNQGWNRAMNLRIGTWSGNSRDYQTKLSTDVITNYISANCTGTGVGCLDVANLPTFTGTTSKVSSVTGGTPVAGTDYTVVPSTSTTDIAGKINLVNVTTTGSIGCTSGATGTAASGCTTTTVTSGARASVGGLELSMPNNGYNIQDWWKDGDGVVTTGVMPTLYACAYGVNADGTMPANSNPHYYTGPKGERHDGVLTLQIIKSSTPNNMVQMNVPGQPIYGFRVIDKCGVSGYPSCPSGVTKPIVSYVLAEYTLYWHHPNQRCMGDTSTKWTTTNNEGDPWWPAQETTSASYVSSTANSTVTTMGILSCVVGGPNNASGSVSWKSTAYTAANTSPYGGALGGSGGPAGWTITPPQDSANTLPICPTYNYRYDDPRTASFITAVGGGSASGGGTTSPPSSAPLTSGMGGAASGGTISSGGNVTTLPGGTPGTTAGGGTTTNNTTGAPPAAGRINWRELIGQ